MSDIQNLASSATVALNEDAYDTVLQRQIADGIIRFEQAEAGTFNAKGERRQSAWRAYQWIPNDGKRKRLTSVTTLIGTILSKDGLLVWGEAAGAKGAIEAVRRGFLDPDYEGSVDMAPGIVRANRLGADAARDEAANRGLDTHSLIESVLAGTVPSLSDYPIEQHGYVQAACKWLLSADPEPELVEHIVGDPSAGYAGRLDLVARSGGKRILYDAKSNEKGQVFPAAHLQLGLLERGMRVCGDGEVDERIIVSLGADGEFAEVPCRATPELVEAAVQYATLLRPVTSACEARNRKQRKAALAA